MSQGTIALIYETPDDAAQQRLPDLSGGIRITGPISGLGAPPMDFMTDDVFDQHGELARLTGHRFRTRNIAVPISLLGSDGGEVLRTSRVLGRALNPFRGTGKLHVVRSDDPNPRYARCRYMSGLQAAEHGTEDWGDMWSELVLQFHCFDPFFYDAIPRQVTWASSGATTTPFFPMFASASDVGPHFGSSNVFLAQDVTNAGDMPAQPQWTINGPIANPLIVNETTGDKIDLSADGGLTLVGGDVLTIDTTPGVLRVLVNGFAVFSKLTADSTLFHLQLGVNRIMVSAGAVTGQTFIALTYAQRWLSA